MLVSYRLLAATTAVTARVLESHDFSWSRSCFSKIAGVVFPKLLESGFQNCWSRGFKIAGVGVSKLLESGFQNCWSRGFKIAGVGVSKLLESGFQKCWRWSRFLKSGESESVVGVDFLNLNKLLDGIGILKNLQTSQPWLEEV